MDKQCRAHVLNSKLWCFSWSLRYEYLLKQSHYISSLNKFLFQSTLARPLLSAVLLFLGFDHYLRKQLKFWILHFDKNKLSIEEIEILVNSEKKYSIISFLKFSSSCCCFSCCCFSCCCCCCWCWCCCCCCCCSF